MTVTRGGRGRKKIGSMDLAGVPVPQESSKAVRPAKQSKSFVTGSRVSSNIKVVPGAGVPTRTIFVSRVCPDTSVADVRELLKKEAGVFDHIISRVKSKYDSYASFHVQIVAAKMESLLSPDLWPSGACISVFYGKLFPERIVGAEFSSIFQRNGSKTLEGVNHINYA